MNFNHPVDRLHIDNQTQIIVTSPDVTRWLEFATVEYRYDNFLRYIAPWAPVRFISP